MTRPRILLDCDPGIDDTFAIFCALRFADLVAVTTVSGNVPIEYTTRNACFAIDIAGASVPVHRGAAAPLEVEPAFAAEIHGAAGLGNFITPEPEVGPQQSSAIEAIQSYVAAEPGLIVATGPLTNIAEAFLADPGLVTRVTQLFWMGGSTTVGNTTEYAEFNAWADPHAVEVVFSSGIPVTMFGLNLTHLVRMSSMHVERLRSAATPTSIRCAEFLQFYEPTRVKGGLGQAMHDPCAVLGITHPELFVTEPSFSVVETSGPRRGQTRISDMNDPDSHPIDIATSVDSPAVIDLIIDSSTDPTRANE